MPSTLASAPVESTTITLNSSPKFDVSVPSSPSDTTAARQSPPPSFILTTPTSTGMNDQDVISVPDDNILAQSDDQRKREPIDVHPPQEDQTPTKNEASPTISIITSTTGGSRSTTPTPITTTSASFEEKRRQEQKEVIPSEPCSPLSRTSSLALSGTNTPTPLSSTSGQATPIPGQREYKLRVNTKGSTIGSFMNGELPDIANAQLGQQGVPFDDGDGSAVVNVGPVDLNGPEQGPQAPDVVSVSGASSPSGRIEETGVHGESGKVHSSVGDARSTSSSPTNVPQYATYPQSYDISTSAPHSAPAAWNNPVFSPISDSAPASRRTSASVDEVLIPPSSASSASFPSSASSLSTSFVSSASSSSLAFSVTSSDWGSNDGGWDPAFVYGYDQVSGERKIDPSYSMRSGYPSPFFAHSHSETVPRSSISLARESGYGDPLHDTEAARLGLSPDPSSIGVTSANRIRFIGSSNTGGRRGRWGIGAIVRAIVRPVRAGVMWTLTPLSGRSYTTPFRVLSSPFSRTPRVLTSTSQAVQSTSSLSKKPADFTPLFHLCLYFMLNLSLTLYNKKVLGKFPFPYTLTAVHALCGWIGTGAMFWWAGRRSGFGRFRALSNAVTGLRGGTKQGGSVTEGQGGMLSGKEKIVLVAFSVLYTVNIVVSNASLRLVTVPFHQVVRASAPFFTILFSAILLGKRSSRKKLLSLIPVVIGVGFATYGDYYFTPLGFFLTLLGTLLAALKTILTNVILVKPGSASTKSSLPTINNPLVAQKPRVAAVSTGTDEGFVGIELDQPQNRHGDGEEKDRSILKGPIDSEPHQAPVRHWESKDRNTSRSFFGSMFNFAEGVFRQRTKRSHSDPTLAPLSTIPLHSDHLAARTSPGTFTLGLIGLSSVKLPKLSLTPLHLLYLLSPLAFMQTMMLAQFTGELVDVRGWLFGTANSALAGGIATATSAVGKNMHMAGVVGTGGARWSLVLNGIMAFMLNVVSFNANRRVGPLGMSVAANVKQVLTILCAVSMFDLTITPANGLGIVLTLLGGATYAYVEVSERMTAALEKPTPPVEHQQVSQPLPVAT